MKKRKTNSANPSAAPPGSVSAGATPPGPVIGEARGCLISLHVQPRASRTQWAGAHGASLKLRVNAPPVDGKANDEIARFLAGYFGCARGDVEWVSGLTGRDKKVRLRGVAAAAAMKKLRDDAVLP